MNYIIKIYKTNRKGRDLFTASVSIKVKFEVDKKEIGSVYNHDLYEFLNDIGKVEITGDKLALIVELEFTVIWNRLNLGRLSKRLTNDSLQKLIDRCEGGWLIKRPKHVNLNYITTINNELPESTINLDYLFEKIEEVCSDVKERIIRSDYIIINQMRLMFKNNYTIL